MPGETGSRKPQNDSLSPWLKNSLWAGAGAIALLVIGSFYGVVERGMDSWVRDAAKQVIREDVQIQEVLRVSKENRDKAIETEKILIQIQADQKMQAEFLRRILDAPRSNNSGS